MAQRIILLIYLVGMTPLLFYVVATEISHPRPGALKRVGTGLLLIPVWPFLLVTSLGRAALAHIITPEKEDIS